MTPTERTPVQYTIAEARDAALDYVAVPDLQEAARLLELEPLTNDIRAEVTSLIAGAMFAIGQAWEKQAILDGEHPGLLPAEQITVNNTSGVRTESFNCPLHGCAYPLCGCEV